MIPRDAVRARDAPLTRLIDDARVACAESDPRAAPEAAEASLFPREREAVARAVDKRRREYATGRWLARRALGQMGWDAMPLIADRDRVPIWPTGVIGSITHTDVWCAAAVARSSEVSALGIDVEARTPLARELWERVCRPEERDWLTRRPDAERGLLAKAFFSAKESLYKALFPRVRQFLEFQAVSLALVPGEVAGAFEWRATLHRRWGPFDEGTALGPGRLCVEPLVSSCLILGAPSTDPSPPGQNRLS